MGCGSHGRLGGRYCGRSVRAAAAAGTRCRALLGPMGTPLGPIGPHVHPLHGALLGPVGASLGPYWGPVRMETKLPLAAEEGELDWRSPKCSGTPSNTELVEHVYVDIWFDQFQYF